MTQPPFLQHHQNTSFRYEKYQAFDNTATTRSASDLNFPLNVTAKCGTMYTHSQWGQTFSNGCNTFPRGKETIGLTECKLEVNWVETNIQMSIQSAWSFAEQMECEGLGIPGILQSSYVWAGQGRVGQGCRTNCTEQINWLPIPIALIYSPGQWSNGPKL